MTSSAASSTPAASAASVREDFNGDGRQDLAVAASGGTVAGDAGSGYVVVTYGSAAGSGTASRTVVSQNTPGVPGVAEADDRFDTRLVARDLDGDCREKLAVSAPWQNGSGAVWSLLGTAAGPAATGSTAFNPVDLGIPAANARFGAVVANDDGTSLYPATP